MCTGSSSLCGECTDGVGWSPSGDEGNDSDNRDRSCAQQGCSKGTKPPPRVAGTAQSSLCAAVWPKWCSCTQISVLIQKSSVLGVGAGTDWKHDVCGTVLLLSYFARSVSAALSSSRPAPRPMQPYSHGTQHECEAGRAVWFLPAMSLQGFIVHLLLLTIMHKGSLVPEMPVFF